MANPFFYLFTLVEGIFIFSEVYLDAYSRDIVNFLLFLFRILLKRREKRRIWLQLLIQNTHNIIPPF